MTSRTMLRAIAPPAFLLILTTTGAFAQSAPTAPKAPDAAASGRGRRGDPVPPQGPAPKTADGHVDLSGYWSPSHSPENVPGGNIGKDYPGYKLPFTPAGEAAHKYNVEHTIDPEALCIVGGVPRHNASGLAFQIVQGQERAVFLYWYTTYRIVPFFSGVKHTEDPDPSFFGEEIGSWQDKNTLVIDSAAFKEERTWADENADPHSDQLHLVEKWTRPDLGHLHLEETIYDSKYYTEPVHYQRTWILGRPEQQLKEYSCAENNVDAAHLGPGPGAIGANGERGYEKLAPLPPPPSKDRPAVTSIPQ